MGYRHGIKMTEASKAYDDMKKVEELHQTLSQFKSSKLSSDEEDQRQREINSDQNIYLSTLLATITAMRERVSNFKVQSGSVGKLVKAVKELKPLDLSTEDEVPCGNNKEMYAGDMSVDELYDAIVSYVIFKLQVQQKRLLSLQDSLVEEINHTSQQLLDSGTASKLKKHIDIDKNSIKILTEHMCNGELNTPYTNFTRYQNVTLNMDLMALEIYEQQRSTMSAKQISKLRQAKDILEKMLPVS